ncbi:MAG: hypothetical protein LBL41_04630 [Bifidobacteriaceae bacterium]|jgi:hypothetical protein|nr:hypothetical protein [Bifidobacteriaceae bacterium]
MPVDPDLQAAEAAAEAIPIWKPETGSMLGDYLRVPWEHLTAPFVKLLILA